MHIPKPIQGKSLNIRKTLNELQTVIKKAEREKIYKGFLKEIPGGTLSLFSEDGRQKFKHVYLDNRIAGVGKSESLQITTTLITRSFKNNKLTMLKGIEKAVKKITNRLKKAEFLGDEESIEEFPEGDENIEKAEEGDTKSIFGKPATFRGGKWVVDEGGGKKKEPEGAEPKGTEPEGEEPSIQEMSNEDSEYYDETVAGYSNEIEDLQRRIDTPMSPPQRDKLEAQRDKMQHELDGYLGIGDESIEPEGEEPSIQEMSNEDSEYYDETVAGYSNEIEDLQRRIDTPMSPPQRDKLEAQRDKMQHELDGYLGIGDESIEPEGAEREEGPKSTITDYGREGNVSELATAQEGLDDPDQPTMQSVSKIPIKDIKNELMSEGVSSSELKGLSPKQLRQAYLTFLTEG